MSSEQDIITQIEYYLSDKNLERDEFFHKTIAASETGFIDIDCFLKCNKVKKMEITVDDIVKALSKSTQVEVNAEAKTIRRQNNKPLPGLIVKKQKIENNNITQTQKSENKTEQAKQIAVKIEKPQNPLIFCVTTQNNTNAMHWKLLEEIINKMYSIKPIYVRYSKIANEGNFIVDKDTIDQAIVDKMISEGIKIGEEYEAKITVAEGNDLETFYTQHGSHYDQCMELSSLGKTEQNVKKQKLIEKKEARKRNMVRFCGEKYLDIGQLKNSFKGILGRTGNAEKILEPYHEMLVELIKYHATSEEKTKDLSHFTVDVHPVYNETRCFFVVKNDGEKVDFSFTKCLARLDEQRRADL